MNIKCLFPVVLSTVTVCAFAQTAHITAQPTADTSVVDHQLAGLPPAKPEAKATPKVGKAHSAKKQKEIIVKQLAPNQDLLHINLKANSTTGY